jgi:hypothetical protein
MFWVSASRRTNVNLSSTAAIFSAEGWRLGSTRDRANGAYCQYVRLYKMIKKKGRRPTSGEEMATALDRWDEEGGAQDVAWPLPYEVSDLRDVERRVLECLGAALVSEWNDLPTDVQRRLFEHAASDKSHDATLLKTQIARFLHDHKDASGKR